MVCAGVPHGRDPGSADTLMLVYISIDGCMEIVLRCVADRDISAGDDMQQSAPTIGDAVVTTPLESSYSLYRTFCQQRDIPPADFERWLQLAARHGNKISVLTGDGKGTVAQRAQRAHEIRLALSDR